MNGEDVFVYHLSVVISQCRKPDQEERVFLGSQFQSLQLGRCFWLFVRENIIVGRQARQLLGKREARDGRQREQGARDKLHPSNTYCLFPVCSSPTL